MNIHERKKILDALPEEERMRVIRHCASKTISCPLGFSLLALPFVLLGVFLFFSKDTTITTAHSVAFVAGSTGFTILVVILLTITRGPKVMDEALKGIQQSSAGDVANRAAPEK